MVTCGGTIMVVSTRTNRTSLPGARKRAKPYATMKEDRVVPSTASPVTITEFQR